MPKLLQQSRGSPLVTMSDVTLQIGNHRVLEHIDWTILRGERWAIVGRNGSGKSALARALYGATPVVGGEITHHFLDSCNSSRVGRLRLAPEDFIAHVSFDDHKHLIGGQSSYYQSRWNSVENGNSLRATDFLLNSSGGTPRSADLTEEARSGVLQQLGIQHLLDRKIAYLSNGEMRKLLLAQALLRSPSVLILDEPFAGLDHRSRESLKRIITHLMKRIECLVFVTSQIEEIPDGVTRTLWLEDGNIAGMGETTSILKSMSGGSRSSLQRRSAKPAGRCIRRKTVSEPKPLLEMSRVSVAYGDVRVLRGIDWSVREGEHWALVGPNGSGKTTLLSLISADNPQAYANDIRLFGRKRGSGESIWDVKRKIGWMSPEMLLHSQRQTTVFQMMCSGFFDSVGLYQQCSHRQHHSASTVMRLLQLSEFAQDSFETLSAGRQRMALLGRALVKKPKLLILDEPCHGMDPENRAIVLDAVERIGREGRTTLIFVTHRLDEVPACISHALRLSNGRVLKKGDRAEVLGR